MTEDPLTELLRRLHAGQELITRLQKGHQEILMALCNLSTETATALLGHRHDVDDAGSLDRVLLSLVELTRILGGAALLLAEPEGPPP